MFSCNDLKKISNQLETVKGNQDILIAKQKDFDKKIGVLQNSVKNINVASNKKPADKPKPKQKRKNPNPDFVHDLPIGGSVVMGNPNARVTITEFTDFQ
jgi:protein-disulfide isomerase